MRLGAVGAREGVERVTLQITAPKRPNAVPAQPIVNLWKGNPPTSVSSNKDDARASIFQDSPRIKPARYACMLVCLYAGISSGKIYGE